MNISPGNLYDHYRTKEKIVDDLFAAYRSARSKATLAATGKAPASNAEDLLALPPPRVRGASWSYRFIYRDINELIPSRYRGVETQFKRT